MLTIKWSDRANSMNKVCAFWQQQTDDKPKNCPPHPLLPHSPLPTPHSPHPATSLSTLPSRIMVAQIRGFA